jgi:hypothetical protein
MDMDERATLSQCRNGDARAISAGDVPDLWFHHSASRTAHIRTGSVESSILMPLFYGPRTGSENAAPRGTALA